jgi:glycosyltransferase involved in cell wall biosynthesis
MALYAAAQKQVSRYLSTHLICVSADLARRLSLDRLSKLSIVHNAVDLESEKAIDDIFPEKPAIVSAGRLAPIKRLDRALRVFRKVNLLRQTDGLTPAHLYIMGEGPEESVLRRLSEELGINEFVNFVGFRQDAPELLSCADLVILSSDSEGIPTVVLEALSFGVPVAATDVGGLKEVRQVVNSPLFVLCPRDDEEQFAISLASLLKQDFLDQDKEQVRKAVKGHFSPRSAVRKLEAIFELF